MDLRSVNSENKTAGWFVPTASSTIAIIALYLVTVLKIAPSYMKSRPAYNLRTFIISYNIIQILTCIYLIYKICSINLPIFHFWKCVQFNPGSTEEKDYHFITNAMFLIKISEYSETVVFILRQKQNQVSFLHIFHHCSTLTIAYFFNTTFKNSATFFPLIINSFVHIIMYTYYLMAATLPKDLVVKLASLKKSITAIQMIQFTIVLMQVVIVMCLGCKIPSGPLFLYITMIVVIFYKFYEFYQKSYSKKKIILKLKKK